MRILGIDYGDARIGTSVCDEMETMALPLKTVKSESMRKNIDAMAKLAREESVGLIVVGLPLNMDGSEGERASKTRSFGKVLSKVTGLEVEYVDERLTSVEAEEIMDTVGVKKGKRKGIIDTIAAQIILQTYLDIKKKK
ncbi:MAG: Holliday junction resolvase RuvX [Clostridia bacterium]|nr:Holliday junction resolvase RuvX [Clostridia bacterium]